MEEELRKLLAIHLEPLFDQDFQLYLKNTESIKFSTVKPITVDFVESALFESLLRVNGVLREGVMRHVSQPGWVGPWERLD